MTRAKGKINSHCIGKWELKDDTCNGDAEAETEEERKACKWKKRCRAFTKYLAGANRKPEDFLDYGNDGEEEFYVVPKDGVLQFKKFCDALIKRNRKRSKSRGERKRPGGFDARKLGPCTATKKAAAKALTARSRIRKRELLSSLNDFKVALVENTEGRAFAKAGKIIKPGQFFLVSKIETSSYISVLCKVANKRDAAVISFKLKTATLSFDVKIPLTPKEFMKGCTGEAKKAFKPEPLDDGGRYKTLFKKVERKKIVLLGETVAKLISDDKIVLPSA